MRLRQLRFQAIGPFPGEHEIDFDQLASSGLFMLEGPTGSGKSTVIDAIVYALYGQVAGAESVTTRMRSDYADPATPSWVELTFETDAGTYVVRRSPEYLRPKQRGHGTTPEKATALLSRLAADGETVVDGVTGPREVGEEVLRLVGLSREQLTQVVVLPQGQFAQFLQAGTEERSRLLQRVFGTEVFERVQRLLAEQARQARAERVGVLERAGEVLQRLAEAAGMEAETVASVDEALRAGQGDVVEEALAEELRRLAESVATTEATRVEAQQQADATEAALTAERALQAALERRSRLLAEQTALAARADEVVALTHRVERAHRAASVVPLIQQRDDARQALARAETTLTTRRSGAVTSDPDLVGSCDDVQLSEDRVAWLREQGDAAASERAQLTALVAVESALPAQRLGLTQAEAELPAAEERLVAQRTEIEGLRAILAEDHARLEEVARVAEGLATAVQDLEKARADQRRVAEHEAAVAQVARLEEELADAVRADELADRAHQRVRREWVAGQGGRLAEALAEGQECPVCGSVEHPRPAEHADLVSDAALEASQQRREEAHSEMMGAKARRDSAVVQRDQLSVALPAHAEEDVAAAETRVRTARAAQDEGKRLTRRIQDTSTRLDALVRASGAAETALTQARADVERRRTELQEQAAQLVEARGEADSVAARQQRAAERATTARGLAEAVASVVAARGTSAAQEQALARWLEEQRFADVEEAIAAALPASELAAATAEVDGYRADVRRVRDALASEPVASLDGSETPDVDAAQDKAHAASEVRDGAVVAAQQAVRARDAAQRHAERLREQVDALVALDDATGPLVRMAELAAGAGSNTARQTLSTFVLVQRFQEVLDAANSRLAAMTGGRYAMQRSTEKEKGSREQRTGLGILVVDHETECTRSPRSLSGGETFQFSLCLALGLADVVTQENGGIHMGTLFIDEGFGTLDAEVLEVVMRELTALHQHGHRAVGVVSHVAEMKNQISERVEVRRGERGSTLTVVA